MSVFSGEIDSWDGKSVAALQSTFERHRSEKDFVATILEHVAVMESQRAATWLLKRYVETGNSLSAVDCQAVLGVLSDQDHWESKLHILQCLPYLDIREEDCTGLEEFLDACIKSERKFVRAWAYNGFNVLAMHFPRYRKEVDDMLTRAVESEAASVRARIRNILQKR